jgi:hypothetical protein
MKKLDYLWFAVGCGLCTVSAGCGAGSAEDSNGGGTGGININVGTSGGSNGAGADDTNGGDTSSNNGKSSGCAQQQVPIHPGPPDILIIQDRSLSMTQDINDQPCEGGSASGDGNCGTASKWYQVTVAVKSVVEATQAKVNWGLFYLGDEPTECGASETPAVPITPDTSYEPIAQSLDSTTFTGAIGTPTAAVVNNAVAYLKTLDSNSKYLLIATDGEPNCAGGRAMRSDPTGARNAVAQAKTAGIPTFVVGIATTSSSAATTALNAMAVAGGHAQEGTATQYYAVTDTASLEETLSKIVGLAVSCTIPLSNIPTGEWTIAIAATDSSTGKKVEIRSDDKNGWSYTDKTKTAIQLNGTSCSDLGNGTYSGLDFVYTCSGGTIVLK